MSILQEIIEHKRYEVMELSRRIPEEQLKTRSRPFPLHNFYQVLARPGIQIIAEIKRKSPSAGNIHPSANPVDVAREYEKNGAAAISVLTDKTYFGGNIEFLQQIKSTVSIPLLRKDFIISEYQIYESYIAGADAILLIADALNENTLKRLHTVAKELGMAVLVEVYTKKTLHKIKKINPDMVGVNARNLVTMKTDLHRFQELFPLLPHSLRVAESGVQSVDDLRWISRIGYDAVLMGTTLMSSNSPGDRLNQFVKEVMS